MAKRRLIYKGKSKDIFEGPEPGTLVQHFKDDISLFDDETRGTITGKGVINNRISELLMTRVQEIGVPTHFVRRLNMREQLIREVEIIPIQVVIRNVVAGSIVKRLGIKEGTALPRSIVEYFWRNESLGNPLVSEEHITAFGWAVPQDIDDMLALALRINDFLTGLFFGVGLRLIDFEAEFGRFYDENGDMRIILADEISLDSCRLWDLQTNEKMDRERLHQGSGDAARAYQEVARRLGVLPDIGDAAGPQTIQ